jgi:hypothetical protein
VTGVAGQTDRGLDEHRDESRDREDPADLEVREVKIGADRRPRGLADAVDQLVEQLDREERGDREREAAGTARSGERKTGATHLATLHRGGAPVSRGG